MQWCARSTQQRGVAVAAELVEGALGEAGFLYDALAHVAAGEGLSIRTEASSGDLVGFYKASERPIWLRSDVPLLQQVKTLAHELAHHFCGHIASTPETEPVTVSSVAGRAFPAGGGEPPGQSWPSSLRLSPCFPPAQKRQNLCQSAAA